VHAALVRPLRKFTKRIGIKGIAFRQFAFGVDPGSQVFHTLDDLLERWTLLRDPIATRREAYGYQTGVLLRKRA
jgi:hypothetical protein